MGAGISYTIVQRGRAVAPRFLSPARQWCVCMTGWTEGSKRTTFRGKEGQTPDEEAGTIQQTAEDVYTLILLYFIE